MIKIMIKGQLLARNCLFSAVSIFFLFIRDFNLYSDKHISGKPEFN